jgi:hypothetical protein
VPARPAPDLPAAGTPTSFSRRRRLTFSLFHPAMRPGLLLTAALVLAPLATSAAQQRPQSDSLRDDSHFSWYDRGPYRESVPRPEALLGYELGDFNTQYSEQERVLLAIAAAAPERVHVEEIGTTSERRRMRFYIVSAPENIARLDAIRADLARLADPRTTAAAELDAIAARVPTVVWLSFSVHGNESPGFETAMQLLWQLAASEEPATQEALRNAIVIINPSANPDGHERFTVWYNSVAVGHPDPGAAEHREPWSIQGRFNHYRFDMNRDVMASTQREVRAMLAGLLRWNPHVAVDLHGVTEQYFFPPAARPVNANMGPLATRWLEILGRGNADAFDRYGWMYFTRDVFDLYYPGYWDSWPTLTGATGMTFETDGGGWKGTLWRRSDGTYISFRDGIAKHYVAALATVETVASRRSERVRDYLAFRRNAIAEGRTGTMKRVVFLPGRDPARAAELAATLLRAGIEVRAADASFVSTRAHAFADGSAGRRSFPAGAYVVDLAQPQGKVAKAILEPSPSLDPEFARGQVERFRRNLARGGGEGYDFYDLTAWSLPVAFGVEAFWTEDAVAISGALLTLTGPDATLIGGEALPVTVGGGIRSGTRARSAYVFSPERSGAAPLAYKLMRHGFRVAVATEGIEAGGRSWPRGSYVLRVGRNPDGLHEQLDRLSREHGVEVEAIASAFADEGQYGVGSSAVVPLTRPVVAILGDEGVGQTSYGALWWNFEQRFGIDFMPVTHAWMSRGDFGDVNVLIIPDASAGALASRINSGALDRLKQWIRGGGTLITMGGSTAWAARESVDLTSARAVGGGDDADTTGVPDPSQSPDSLIPVRSPGASNASPAPVPGSHFDVALDRTHWLTHGYERPRMTVLLDGSTFLTLSKDGRNVAVFPQSGAFHRAGFIWPDNTERLLRGTAYLIHEPMGGGHVVAFTSVPMFRAWWRALDTMVLNAVLLGPTF